MLESIIMLLIYICLFALAVVLVYWVLQSIGVVLPPQAIKIIGIIFALIVVLLLVRIVLSGGGLALPGLH